MESFQNDGCLSDEGLHALIAGQLDELGRLEAAEHLAYCDKCTDRYTALLTADALSDPPRSVRRTVMGTIWVRLMQSTCGRAAVAGVAAVLALTIWLYDKGAIGFEGILTCTIAMMGSFGPVVALSSLSNNLNQTLASGERVLSLLEETPLVEEIPGDVETPGTESVEHEFTGAEAENVTFAYDNEVILDNYSLKLQPGTL